MRDNATLESIRRRRSTRSFTEEQLAEEELQAVLEAGRCAPSARNQQKWNFTVVQSPEMLAALNRDTKAAAQESEDPFVRQRASAEDLNIFYGAPTVVIMSGDPQGNLIQLDCAAALGHKRGEAGPAPDRNPHVVNIIR